MAPRSRKNAGENELRVSRNRLRETRSPRRKIELWASGTSRGVVARRAEDEGRGNVRLRASVFRGRAVGELSVYELSCSEVELWGNYGFPWDLSSSHFFLFDR
ncbi:hypothetical protein CDL15_Pgr011684 [Punica granatum]|uniref:Uncharacterized protein n=1 Tax=Punica granatum TaxID=22663 RepID=A0A218WWN1_PUNGR|nr:hypothetical protein CDL15_Pgr011684 [Punica granatum]PKI61885.1 hypothetical protein CRG98_017714 [Punica granatum]